MAFEIRGRTVSVPASTGLINLRLVALSTGATTPGWAVKPALGAPVLGAICAGGTTGSTNDPQYITVQVDGIAKVQALTGTLAAGDLVQATSVGYVKNTTAGSYTVGMCVAGSSGGTGRVVSVLLSPIGTT